MSHIVRAAGADAARKSSACGTTSRLAGKVSQRFECVKRALLEDYDLSDTAQ